MAAEFAGDADVAYLIDYVKGARRGVIRALPRRGGDEDGGDDAG